MNRRYGTALLVCIASALTAACTGTAIEGNNGKTYQVKPHMDTSGVFHRITFSQDISDGVKAAVAGLKSLEIKVTDSRNDKIIGQVEGEMADGKKVRITVQKNMEETEMRIYLANKSRAMQILKAITERL